MDFTGNPTVIFALRWTRPVGDPHIGCPRSASRVAGEPGRCHSSPLDSPVRSHLGHLSSSPTLALLFPFHGRRSASTPDGRRAPPFAAIFSGSLNAHRPERAAARRPGPTVRAG